MNYVLLIIPWVMPMPRLSTDLENPPTPDEVALFEEWQAQDGIFQRIKAYMDQLPLSGSYAEVISLQAPVWTKDCKNYFIYSLDQDRFAIQEEFNTFMGIELTGIAERSPDIYALIEQGEIRIIITANPRQWLTDNGYIQEGDLL